MTSKLIVPPTVEPVALDEMKNHARIDHDGDDALIASLITAARQWAEQYTRRAFIAQTYQMTLDAEDAHDRSIRLAYPPLIAVNSVELVDEADVATTLGAENYFVDTMSEPGRLVWKSIAPWPIALREVNGIVIEYVAGYGDAAGDVPEAIKLAIKQIAAHWYEHRGEAVIMSSTRHDAVANQAGVNVPFVIQALLDPFRIKSMGGV